MELKYGDITEKIIAAAYKVHNTLGYGFAEKIYHRALALELTKKGLIIETEKQLVVKYEGTPIGEFFADLYVNNKIIVELKATENHLPVYEAQLLNYLKATGSEIGLLINFGKSVTVRRFVL
jgi:GxxExxY protein